MQKYTCCFFFNFSVHVSPVLKHVEVLKNYEVIFLFIIYYKFFFSCPPKKSVIEPHFVWPNHV